jgi:hypothetical protein
MSIKSSISVYFKKLCQDSKEIDHTHTAELHIFLYMIEQLLDVTGYHHSYILSLSESQLPNILAWPIQLRYSVEGTNLMSSIQKVEQNLLEKLNFIQKVIQYRDLNEKNYVTETINEKKSLDTLRSITYDKLLWAWSHYVSRRYPEKFGLQDMFENQDINIDIIRCKNEASLQNLGSLCPLLDILNHDESKDWLRLEVNTNNNQLYVICNYPVQPVRFIF